METIELAKIFKALSNEQRLNLFKMLYEWNGVINPNEEICCDGVDRCFTKACCSLDLSRSTISHHMKELQNAGLITFTRNGQSFVCKINPEALKAVREFLK
jgi:ArsR family transcriptional regulator, arsenate/arsenite/antimonite-responsive transcriptional repressor